MTRTDDAGSPTWPGKALADHVRPHKRNLVLALQALCRHLRPDQETKQAGKTLTQAKAARRLLCCESVLSRGLSGQSMPSPAMIEALHREASLDAGGEHMVGITLDALRLLHKKAEAERHRLGNEESAAEIDALSEQLRTAEAECAALRQEIEELTPLREEVSGLRAAVDDLKATRAGLQGHLTVRQETSTPPPVPRRRGDRRQMRRDVSAVRNLAAQVSELDAEGRAEIALRLLRRSSTEVLNPLETAGLLLLLRQQQQDELADNLIHVYGRDQADRDVLHVALTLHEQGSPDDAGAILQAALE
ncbi:hypothetical protein [Streptomyces sp. enrichment culture]|uniref:hypothetical protein n=1 Tax=Streptomyces sp. enrichment culture TaxID=1795815 RepID=UPI003F56C4A4